MLTEVLTRIAADTGFDPVQQRSALINLLNQGARELYNMLECNALYREVTLVVPPDSVIALPSFVGQLRGMRMHTNELPFDLASIGQPRYTATTLQFKFKNWRDLGISAILTYPTTVGPLTINCPLVEQSPVEIKISGQTNIAQRLEETILIDENTVTTINLFGPEIYGITCVSDRTADITISDANGTLLAILYNNDLKTRYKKVDVSQIFWTLDTQEGQSLIDVCYKVPISRLTEDSDAFYAGDDYDNAWYSMCMHLFLTPLQGRGDEALAAKAAAIQACTAAKEGSEQEIIKKLFFGRNKFFGIFRKYRYFPGSVTSVDHNVQT